MIDDAVRSGLLFIGTPCTTRNIFVPPTAIRSRIPEQQLNMYGRRAERVVQSPWSCVNVTEAVFRRWLKRFCLHGTSTMETLGTPIPIEALYKFALTSTLALILRLRDHLATQVSEEYRIFAPLPHIEVSVPRNLSEFVLVNTWPIQGDPKSKPLPNYQKSY